MKHIFDYTNFKDLMNESVKSVTPLGSVQKTGKLNQAADIINDYLNKKTRKDFKKFPFVINSKGTPGIMLYSNKDNSAVRIGAKDRNTGPGIIGTLSYFSDDLNNRADFTISSDNFSVVALVSEFANLINNKRYVKEVEGIMESESLHEAKTKPLTSKEKAMVLKQLKSGTSAAQIARDLGISYGQILKLKKNELIPEDTIPAVKENEKTLEDKAKFLDETLEDIYDISRKVAAGAFNSLMISGRAGTGKTYQVEKALKDEGLIEDEDYLIISGSVSTVMMYKKLFQYKNKTLVFDDADAVFRDESGRNILKAALDTKKVRRISYLKKSSMVFDPKDYESDPEGEFLAIENGLVPSYFEFTGRVIFISNLDKDKADPDGAIQSRSILIDVNPDDATLMERIKTLLPVLEPRDMPLSQKEEVYEFMKESKDVSMRTFVKAAGLVESGVKNWQRKASRYL